MNLHSTLIKYLPYLGSGLLFIAFLCYNQLLELSPRAFDLCLDLGIVLFLINRRDFLAILVSTLFAWRLWDELLMDSGVIDYIDGIEFIVIWSLAWYRSMKYPQDYKSEKIK